MCGFDGSVVIERTCCRMDEGPRVLRSVEENIVLLLADGQNKCLGLNLDSLSSDDDLMKTPTSTAQG